MDQKKLALIHIIKKELGLSQAEYRRILREAAGVSSAKDLDEPKFRKLMNYFVRSRHYRASKDGVTLRQKMFIRGLAGRLDWSRDHIDNFIRKYYHESGLDALSRKEAGKLIEALKSMAARRESGDN